jgi:hypothetical protein
LEPGSPLPNIRRSPLHGHRSHRAIDNGYAGFVIVDNEWRWLGVTPDRRGVQVVKDRGGATEATPVGPIYATPGHPLGANSGPAILGPVSRISSGVPEDRSFVFVAGQQPNGVYLLEGTNTTVWLEPYASMPNLQNANRVRDWIHCLRPRAGRDHSILRSLLVANQTCSQESTGSRAEVL